MIDGLFKARLDQAWDRLAPALSRLGFSANGVTWTGLALSTVVAITYPLHAMPWLLGVLIGITAAFDSLDGAVARHRGETSRYGGYLDAMVDRYQEGLGLATLAWVHECWAVAFAGLAGAMLVPYAKARVAIEIPVDNVAWPDLMERLERTLFVAVGLVVVSLVEPLLHADAAVALLLTAFAVLTHVTAIQRFVRARRLLRASDRD